MSERILVLSWVDYDMTADGGGEGISVHFIPNERADRSKNGRLMQCGYPPAKLSISRENYEIFAKTLTPFYADVEFGARVVAGKAAAVIKSVSPISHLELFKFPAQK